ncbi:hypothetical protein [Enterobacter hormaechei]|uniref:hypothetical protein n=1 Tax=Enterobacter hormaechei TaxID=158836 RepID=UPI000CEBDA62|nr:hypothetical protein [Enterobacter hormaechei]ROC77452.1 hypothetical protein C4Z25_014765 [Enterobacter hormaechei subsp. steigerwaltii]
MKNRDKATLLQINAHPEAQDTSEPGQDSETNQGTQLQVQNADAEALKAYLKYRAEHPEKHVVIDEMPHIPLNIDMRKYSKK